jgi:hypothetical protein
MDPVLITADGAFRIKDPEAADILNWMAAAKGSSLDALECLSIQQVLTRLGAAALPEGFPTADVVIGGPGKGALRGWLESTVTTWLSPPESEEAAQSQHDDSGDSTIGPEPAQAPEVAAEELEEPEDQELRAQPPVDDAAAAPPRSAQGSQWWTDVPDRADKLVTILTTRGAVTPSGVQVSRGPLLAGSDLGQWVWRRHPSQPGGVGRKGIKPQIWITAAALRQAGMTPPRGEIERSEQISDAVAKLFGCTITSAVAGWFTAIFPPPSAGPSGKKSGGEAVRPEALRVDLVLLPFLWTDPQPQRPKDRGMAGIIDSPTALPDDEDEAAEILGTRIAWLSGIADTAAKHEREDPALLAERRPASVGASLLDTVRRHARYARRIEALPLPTPVAVETPSLEPKLELWRTPHPSKKAKGDSVDVEVDQRAAYLASAGQLNLGYGKPDEYSSLDAPALFAPDSTPKFGLWRVTTPPANTLEGLTDRLPLPLGHMAWDESRTFWSTTRGVEHLLAPVTEGGAGMVAEQLVIDRAWIWPEQDRLLRAWADRLRAELAAAAAADTGDERADIENRFRVDYLKGVYKAFLGRMVGTRHPTGQGHYEQPAWAASIWADTRMRAMKYAARVATDHGLYPIEARDIDTWKYRVPPGLDPHVLEEDSPANGKYRIKAPKSAGS